MKTFTTDVIKMDEKSNAECTVMAECPEKAAFKLSVPLKGYDHKWTFYSCNGHVVRVLNAGAYSVAEY